MRAIKKALVLALLAAALVALCYGAVLITHPDTVILAHIPQDAVSVLGQATLQAQHATLSAEGVYQPTRADAGIVISGIPGEFKTLCVKTRDPFPAQVDCQLYYSLSGEPFREAASVVTHTQAADREIVFELPQQAHYDQLRLDIDRRCVLEDLLISSAAPEEEHVSFAALRAQGRFPLPWTELILGFVLFFAAGLAVSSRRRR